MIRMGPSRDWRRHPILSTLEGDNVFDALSALQRKQDAAKDVLKIKVQEILGEDTPFWLKKAGRSGLKRLLELFPQQSPELITAIAQWQKVDAEYIATYGPARKKLAGRLEKGYEMVARDICGWLAGHVGRIAVEESFLKKSAERVSADASLSLRKSVKYRQIAALGVFLTKLQNVAPSYGLQLEKLPGANSTAICCHCGFSNPSSEKLENFCGGCGKLINQDINAAVNLSSFGPDAGWATGV